MRSPRRLAARLAGRGRIGRPATSAHAVLELQQRGAAPLTRTPPAPPAPLEIAAIVPSFRRGSGGHATIVRLLGELARRGHTVTAWLEDVEGRHSAERATVTRRSFSEFFDAEALPLHTDFAAWGGADVVLATGWQTVARAMLLPGCGARAYLVQDHEPEFYGTSAESLWAAETYRHDLHCIAASPWLANLLRERYDASASHFDLAVDPDVYRPGGGPRDAGLVAFYARAATPRRAVPLGLLALEELSRRRDDVSIVLFGQEDVPTPFPSRNLGIPDGRGLAELYSRATAGMVLSLTNPSLVGLEMMACGLPCVELASESMVATFGREGPLLLAEPDPLALCAALERLLDDADLRASASTGGVELMAGRTWERAGDQLELAIRQAAVAGR